MKKGNRRKGKKYSKKLRRKYAHGYRSDGVVKKREIIKGE